MAAVVDAAPVVVEAANGPEAVESEFAVETEVVPSAADGDGATNNKRKLDEVDGAADGENAHIRKRGSFEDVEADPAPATAKVSGFSDAPAGGAAPAATPALAQNGAVTPVAVPVAAAPAASTPVGENQITEYVEIPAAMVGKLIGKGGETIKALQFMSHTKVQIDHQTGGDLKKVSIMSANRDHIEAAKLQIDKIVNTDEPVPGLGEVTRQVDCPQGIVGRIIGRGGETIRALQQASQAHIVVDQNFPEGQPRSVNIKGRIEAVERATKMIQELIQGEPGSAQAIIQKYGAGITRSLDCPKQMVGRVIGKGGDTIKTLQKNFSVNIQIDQMAEPNKITVAGSPSAVDNCLAAITEIIQGGNPIMQPPAGPTGGFGRGGPMPGPYGAGAAFGQSPRGGWQASPGPRGPPGFGGGFPQAGYGGAPPAQPFNAYPGYGAPAPAPAYGGYPQAGYMGYPPYAPQQPAYPQPAAQAPAAGAYPGYGAQQAAADPYAGQQPAYGGQYGAAPAQSTVWQELQDGEGRTYYYNSSNGVSQWEKPPELP